ncbi:MAG: glycosyltransferase family 2 protein, partial [Gammaproteobacteria bacterium]|nr:glycosyltransferase family 2 protein [Gammaproteobacteria bacterium]
MTFVSFIIPVFNEEKVIRLFYDELVRVISRIHIEYEIVFVDDGSIDNTWNILESLQSHDNNVRLIGLSRNFGHQAAMLAGIENARGECVITMDGDLEHPPEIIPQLIEKWRHGIEVVNTRRHSGRD